AGPAGAGSVPRHPLTARVNPGSVPHDRGNRERVVLHGAADHHRSSSSLAVVLTGRYGRTEFTAYLNCHRAREQPMPRQIILASRPSGWPTADNFALAEADRPDLADGQVRVRNLFMSVDPYMRGRMNDVKSYVPAFRLGEPLEGGAVGTVIESRAPSLNVGDLVLHMLGCGDVGVLDAREARKLAALAG